MFGEDEGLIERIERILSENIILTSLDELYENLPLLEYNLIKPNSVHSSELYRFSRILKIFYYVPEQPYFVAKCSKCNNIEKLSFRDVIRIKNNYSDEEIFNMYYNNGFCCNRKTDD